MYYEGEGVVKDYVAAYKWFLLAGAQDQKARKNVSTMESGFLTPNQRAEGQRLARNFRVRPEPPAAIQAGGIAQRESARESSASSGTGFLITANGYIVTNHHVLEKAREIRVLTPNGLKQATQIAVDVANDLALLKIEGDGYEPLPVVSSRKASLGQTVIAIGFPNIGIQGFSPKLAKGEIAGLTGIQDSPRDFQISVPLQPGNSGGALVDERGNVVGVIVAKLSPKAMLRATGSLPENVNYAVKSSYLLSFLESVPEIAAQLPDPNDGIPNFTDAVKQAQAAAVLVLVY